MASMQSSMWGVHAGQRIEELMQQMCSRRIDYYFAPIDGSTVKMCRIMQQAYVHSHNAEFQVSDLYSLGLRRSLV